MYEHTIFYFPAVGSTSNLTKLQYTAIACLFTYADYYKGKLRAGVRPNKQHEESLQFELRKNRFTKEGIQKEDNGLALKTFSKRGFDFANKWLVEHGIFKMVSPAISNSTFKMFNRGALYTFNNEDGFVVADSDMLDLELIEVFNNMFHVKGNSTQASPTLVKKAGLKGWMLRTIAQQYVPYWNEKTVSQQQLEMFDIAWLKVYETLDDDMQRQFENIYKSKFGESLVPIPV